ncbi:MAG: 4Fe-4S dicluster domain-containing protein [Planctomycetota bacterium]|nr:MAG: 4Fe-4S dicluster domain-containing protein [Planctomycetota bacterium]
MTSTSPSTTGADGLPRLGAGIEYEKYLDCVHCGLCTSACPTYLETGNENDSPRGRIYLMRAVTDGRLEMSPTIGRHLELCLDCRSCETACPSGVQYGRLIEPFRVEMQQRAMGSQPSGWFQELILYGLFPYPKRLAWALLPARIMQKLKLDWLMEKTGLIRLLPQKLQRMQRLLPKLQSPLPALPKVLPAIGPRRAKVAMFTGCVAEALFDRVNWATARVLQANGCDVIVPQGQGCCGAIHYHSGAAHPALQLAEANTDAFEVDDVDAIIINVAGCGSMLKDYGHMAHELRPQDDALRSRFERFASKVKDFSEFLASLGVVSPLTPVPIQVAYHDACHLCHAQKIRQQPRDLLKAIPGLKLVPLAESEICCGAAGSYNLTEPEMADRLGHRKAENILASGAEALVSANAGCTLQIQAMLKAAGRPLPVYHPAELLEMAYAQQLGASLAEA